MMYTVRAPVDCRDIALGYVWRNFRQFQLTNANLEDLVRNFRLSSVAFSATVRDAIILVNEL